MRLLPFLPFLEQLPDSSQKLVSQAAPPHFSYLACHFHPVRREAALASRAVLPPTFVYGHPMLFDATVAVRVPVPAFGALHLLPFVVSSFRFATPRLLASSFGSLLVRVVDRLFGALPRPLFFVALA